MSDESSKPQIKTSWLFGIALAFALFAVIGAYSKRMTQDYSDYDEDRAGQRYETLKKLQADENKQLNPVDKQGHPTAVWVDQDKGIISIPIDQAMIKEIGDLKAKTPAAGNEINPKPQAPPAQGPDGAPAPAAPSPGVAPADKEAAGKPAPTKPGSLPPKQTAPPPAKP